ncbi:MAG: DUF1569 domain-containing protein [Planctomycetes bacterium]|nr:DUF1569 domain-containing protein [Planctomycetota bacterium]
MIDTKTAPRREITFATLDEVVADAERLVAANATTTGNWSLGQILEHLAVVMDKTIDGSENTPPLPIRLIGRWFLKKRFLRNGMPAGYQLKGGIAKEFLPEETDSQQALEHLRQAVQRLKNHKEDIAHPFFGPLTHEEYVGINCRHAELHLSFVKEG